MYDMARSQFWRKAVPVVLLLILGRYFWLWLTDLPHPDSQMDMEFVGKVMPICLLWSIHTILASFPERKHPS